MTLSFILNDENITINTEPNRRLIDILRNDFGLTGSKCGCFGGLCGACTVIFNGSVSPACLIPAFRIRGGKITTIEGFSFTKKYSDIERGFNLHDVESCGYCNPAKILVTETLLKEKELPPRDDILLAFDSIRCRCTLGENLIDAVITAAEIRQRRLREKNS
ncbi:MAG: 2Fe-2S iron-sulfur cluster binding domain-containing protein [Spirochaetaceae bacterium]|jgi:carbon-monoxide dehydrogenase small subunit|nr:2Fe-2S iron-sulfur cluster binding domain-containing protein [Spirochaetaceae bacterium]